MIITEDGEMFNNTRKIITEKVKSNLLNEAVLLTKSQKDRLIKQFPKGSSFNQQVVAKIFGGSMTWYLMNMDPSDEDYIWCIVKNDSFQPPVVEAGSVLLSELQSAKIPMNFAGRSFGLPLERDRYFKPMLARDVWDRLNKGEHI